MSPITTPLLLPLILSLLFPLPLTSATPPPTCATTFPAPTPIFNTPPSFSSLPTLLPSPLSPSTARPHDDIQTIRNTLALYPLAIDGKNFATLDRVFTPDVVANYSAPLGVLTPLAVVERVLEASLAPVRSMHVYGTQFIELLEKEEGEGTGEGDGCEGPVQAVSVTYFTANHFGVGGFEGQVYYVYGQYQDSWVKGGRGEWRIGRRNLVYMGPGVGNISIFTNV